MLEFRNTLEYIVCWNLGILWNSRLLEFGNTLEYPYVGIWEYLGISLCWNLGISWNIPMLEFGNTLEYSFVGIWEYLGIYRLLEFGNNPYIRIFLKILE